MEEAMTKKHPVVAVFAAGIVAIFLIPFVIIGYVSSFFCTIIFSGLRKGWNYANDSLHQMFEWATNQF